MAAFLKEHGYEVATCTVDNSDWVFARAYRRMLDRKDPSAARRLRAAYLEYTRQEIEYYARLHQQIFGREISQVMLLHASRLNADTLDQVLKVFEKLKYRFVTRPEAQSDPAYNNTGCLPYGSRSHVGLPLGKRAEHQSGWQPGPRSPQMGRGIPVKQEGAAQNRRLALTY